MRTARVIAAVAVAAMVAGAARAGDERKSRFVASDAKGAAAWQESSRNLLLQLMKLSDLAKAEREGLALDAKVLSRAQRDGYEEQEIEFNSTASRRIKARLTVPAGAGKHPAVVCIHGHGGTRAVVYDTKGIYRGFATHLARRGYVTIAVDVGQHKVFEVGRTLMGERLWDCMRCVSYLSGRENVDRERIGCAGLSLGGEMAMWLGAMDTRVKATVSSGYLTTVANMRNGHCPCWEFPGLTEHFDWPDVYCLIAPRALQCQIGEKERAPGGFPVNIAKEAMAQIAPCYRVLGKEGNAALVIHPEGHVFDLEAGLAFLERALGPER